MGVINPVISNTSNQVVGPVIEPDPIACQRAINLFRDQCNGNTASFKRASTATYYNNDAHWTAPVDVLRVSDGAAILEGSATNKCTCAKSNPQDLTNITKSGDVAAVLSVVNDAAALAAAGLSAFGPNVYKLDNSAGTTNAYAICSGVTGNANAHSLSVFARGSGSITLTWVGSGVNAVTWAGTDGYLRKKIENSVSGYDPASTERLTVKALPGSIVYFTLPQLEEGPVCTSPIPGGTGAITRASEGADTSGNGLSIPLSRAMIDSLSVGGAGTVLCSVYLPWGTTYLPASTAIGVGSVTNDTFGLQYMYRTSGGTLLFPRTSDAINSASLSSMDLPSGYYIFISQWSAALGKMRVGLYNPATGVLTWSSPALAGATTYRGFFPIHASNLLRLFYGGGLFPISIISLSWFNSLLSDADIIYTSREALG